VKEVYRVKGELSLWKL